VQVYTAPQSELGSEELMPKRVKLGKVLSYLSLASLLPIVGIAIAIYQMIGVFQDVTLSGNGDPELMAGGISQSLVPMLLSMIAALPSILCIFLVLFLTTYRSKVFYRLWVLASIVLIVAFPIGTLFGLILGITLFIKRKEFSKNV
jgi:hypothetical protein